MPASKTRVAIIGPATAEANNGKWRTAHRWQRILARRFAVSSAGTWPVEHEAEPPDLLIALHASRSAASLGAFAAAHPGRPSILVLTGTDVYRDIDAQGDDGVAARRSLRLATRLVLLEPEGIARLPPDVRDKADVIVQSAPPLAPRSPDPRWFDLIAVGHLRDEKDSRTAWRAFERVARHDLTVRMIQVGEALEPSYREDAEALAGRNPRFRWLGPLSHALARQQIRRARALVVSSAIEGGAHVVVEAITSGVPVLATAIPGNLGLLGRGYAGTWPVGDDGALADLIDRARRDPHFVALLKRQCAERAPLFAPERERDRLIRLVDSCLPHDLPLP